MGRFALLLALQMALPEPANADVVLAARTVRARTVIKTADVIVQPGDNDSIVSKISQVVGLEALVVLYEGRPISLSDIGPAAIVERNQTVTLVYSSGPLQIYADGRALGRAGVGDRLKVMNLGSRKIVTGLVGRDGSVFVGSVTSERFE